jgi:peptidoglycan/xylan/chitin deacetylase (PgdA/CDA1 family)
VTPLRKPKKRNLQILAYHRVNDDGDAYFPASQVKVFERQMRYVSKNFNVMPLEEAVELMAEGKLPENSVAITFDDGYRDNFEHAYPILRKYGMPATIFLTAGAIGGGPAIWHDKVFELFRSTHERILRDIPDPGSAYPLDTLHNRLAAMHATLRWLRGLPEYEREKGIQILTESLHGDGKPNETDLMLRWEDVVRMKDHGISFGAHTMSHPTLSVLSEERARQEILDSRKTIQAHIATPVRAFAYPNGTEKDFNQTSIKILKEAGFLCAVTTIFGTNSCGDDLFRLKRGGPWETYLPVFAAKMNWYKLAT